MLFPLTVAGVLLVPTLVLTLLRAGWLWLRGRPQAPLWRRAAWLQPLLLLLHLFVTFPLLLGWFGSRGLGTRGDERDYQGPRLAADGSWQLQSRDTLKAERERPADPALVAAARALAVEIPGADGVRLRAFCVPAQGEPVAVCVLGHGLFRSALELEAPASMLRRAGCECWLLEQRNHGGSGRAPATFGLRESADLCAAVQFVRSRQPRELPLLLYGVSLGTVSIALALPQLDRVAGVVLDAPVDDLLAAAHRILELGPRAGRSFFALVEPWGSLTVLGVQLWSGFRFDEVRPAAALQGLPANLPVLLIGGEHDDKVPAASVQALFDSLPMATGTKQLWMVPGEGHGDGFVRDPEAYAAHLRAFVHRAARP